MKEINILIFSLPGKITECCPEHAEKNKRKQTCKQKKNPQNKQQSTKKTKLLRTK